MSELGRVTTKQEAIHFAAERQNKLVQRLIDETEKNIANKYVEDGRIIVYPDEIFHEPELTFEEKHNAIKTFLHLYNSNGWEAKYETSQRDGSWIEVK